jgi:hypothetical protein
LSGVVAPLPAKGQWRTDDGGAAATIAAAVTGRTTEEIFDGMALRSATDEDASANYDLSELEQLLRHVHDRPMIVTWSQIEALVLQACGPWGPR